MVCLDGLLSIFQFCAKREKDALKIKNFNNLKNAALNRQFNETYDQTTLDLTTKILDISPEFFTIWNLRRDVFVNFVFKGRSDQEIHKVITEELRFVLATMKRFPKCYWVWNHRIWLLKYNPALTDWDFELGLIEMFFAADPRNFHAWQYRRIVLEGKMDLIRNEEEQPAKAIAKLNYREFQYTTKMINKNISNYSAWHNRSKLIEKLSESHPEEAQEFSSKYEILVSEIKLVQTAAFTDPADSSVWTYMRWLYTGGFFTTDIEAESFIRLLEEQVAGVKELAEIEKDENGEENLWCLKTLSLLLKELFLRTKEDYLREEINDLTKRLIELDPMRAERYKDFQRNI
ncbi:unnamed protein product [Kuraishia capsulata CBS 1993]|uniref:Geranylgeranyl transferase type-2 subunit alpha n=1 Tax=Kuraishia capsulata CBS 1993 TaxID=1382522 RepID=W6MU32_9ASCO|nr:uncharacterized protein KUCA_T00006028001 [Kuraishia capsulata CBS 1993]CDK30033.1 unnamed protein product [Kuraishia capsulata CBS 1993]